MEIWSPCLTGGVVFLFSFTELWPGTGGMKGWGPSRFLSLCESLHTRDLHWLANQVTRMSRRPEGRGQQSWDQVSVPSVGPEKKVHHSVVDHLKRIHSVWIYWPVWTSNQSPSLEWSAHVQSSVEPSALHLTVPVQWKCSLVCSLSVALEAVPLLHPDTPLFCGNPAVFKPVQHWNTERFFVFFFISIDRRSNFLWVCGSKGCVCVLLANMFKV